MKSVFSSIGLSIEAWNFSISPARRSAFLRSALPSTNSSTWVMTAAGSAFGASCRRAAHQVQTRCVFSSKIGARSCSFSSAFLP